MRVYLFLITLLLYFSLGAQDISYERLNSLGDEELLTLYRQVKEDSVKAEIVARTYLDRGRKEGDTIKMARGYDRLARIFHPEKNIQFADSVIELTKNLNHKTYPALGYILKIYEYERIGDLISQTENALVGYNLALKNENISQQIYIADYLIYSKSVWGNKIEALELQKERHRLMSANDYIQKVKESSRKGIQDNNKEIYLENELSSIMNFVFCHLNLKNLDSSRLYNNLGMQRLYQYNGINKKRLDYWFRECSVEIEFYSRNFEKAIVTSDQLLENESLSNSTILNLNFFKGLSFIELGEYERGIRHLLKADSIYNIKRVPVQPNHRILFEKLLEYHKNNKSYENQILYLNKLLQTDSVFKLNYQYFEPDLIRNFETPKLLREKEKLIAGLKKRNQISTKKMWWFGVLLLLTLLALIYYINRQLLYKKRFETLMTQHNSTNDTDVSKENNKLEISSNIIEGILLSLEEFEANKHYLSKDISLHDLAGSLGTNSNYLSKVINLEKDKNFRNYINDLG